MTVTLVAPDSVVSVLTSISLEPLETAGVLLVTVVQLPGGETRLLAREFHAVEDSAYLRRHHDALTISSEGYVSALGRAEELGAAALWVHTHPGVDGVPRPSVHDDQVDIELAGTFRVRTASGFYGALILSPGPDGPRFTGHIAENGCQRLAIDRIWAVGDRFRLSHSADQKLVDMLGMFDRNIRAFGPAVQSTLSDLTVGVVGCGGTGSAVAEQLARLGVRKFVVFDPDTLSQSNLTRVFGSTAADVGRLKVDVMAEHLRRIAPELSCERVPSMLTVSSAAMRMLTCDVVFGCSDDNAGRLVLSRLPTYFMTPVIDCGVLLSSDAAGELTGIDGRVTTVLPEHACLFCRGRIDIARAAAELMTPDERRRLVDEGYAPALGRIEPAVVTFTSMVASMAVSELLERLIGYGPVPRPTEVLLRFHEREISTNNAVPRSNHYCDVKAGKVGRGLTVPLLDMAWTI